MSQVISVTEDEIHYAEQLLLPKGKVFESEHKDFIRDFTVLDLQAVPGSGKTTALLAKLIILERKLPFADGSGVLVLSHTNAAIDEIKEKIQEHCPKLFSYPNFIGTIQSFVDEFLAIPIYNLKFKKKLDWIDSERYQDELVKLFNIIAWNKDYEEPTKWFYQRHINKATSEANGNDSLKKELCKKYIEKEIRDLHYDFITNEIKNSNNDVLLKDVTNKKFIGLKTIILEVLKRGIMSYDYAYHFAEFYIHKIPIIKEILQKRFSFVFVDEMQDMDTHQYNLLEKVFYDGGSSISKIQRIGDKNQSIYNSVKATNVWYDRAKVLRLNGSQRLSKPIANVLKKFALHTDQTFDIVGKNESDIKPHILVYENNKIENVISCFVQLVKEYKLSDSKKPIKVVCWNTDWKDDETSRNDATKIRLEDYYKDLKKQKKKLNQDFDNLLSYLVCYEKKNTLEPLRKNLLNALVKILRIENINAQDEKPYTKKKLIDFIRDSDIEKYDELNLNLFNWSIGILQGETNEVLLKMKEYLPTMLMIFDRTISKSSEFINKKVEISEDVISDLNKANYYVEDGIEVEITSVHAVKGQTHCATLYLESYYHKDGKGTNSKSYESQRLAQQFLGMQVQADVGNRSKQSTKMVFVGFSRPTELLCIAIQKDRFDNQLKKIDRDIWKIVPV